MANTNQMELGQMFGEMTNYDIFMMNKNKKKAESKLFDRKSDTEKISYVNYKKNDNLDYTSYLIEQLNRRAPGKTLSEEEYYSDSVSCSKADTAINSNIKESAIVKKSAAKEVKGQSFVAKLFRKIFGNIEFKKGSKFFIAFYVLIVVAVAFILIVMNTKTLPISADIMADAGSGDGIVTESTSVQPMTQNENEDENENWFDKLCDSLND